MKPLFFTLIYISIGLTSSAQTFNHTYKDGSAILNGYSVTAGKGKPGVLVLPAWMGIDKHACNTADKLKALGYNALVADIYGEGNRPQNKKEAGERAGYYKSNINQYQHRIKLALDELIKQGADPARIVVIGYCFGGLGAIEAARANFPVKGIVSFHGGLSKAAGRSNNAIHAKVLVLHGADDPNESEAEIKAFQQEMRDGKADWQMVYYGNAVHSFTDPAAGNDNSKGAAYNEAAARRSWNEMVLFLKELL